MHVPGWWSNYHRRSEIKVLLLGCNHGRLSARYDHFKGYFLGQCAQHSEAPESDEIFMLYLETIKTA